MQQITKMEKAEEKVYLKIGSEICHVTCFKLGFSYFDESTRTVSWCIYFVIGFSSLLFTTVTAYHTSSIAQDPSLVDQLRYFAVMFSYCLFVLVNNIRSRKAIDEIYIIVGKNFFEYPDPDQEVEKLKKKLIVYTTWFRYFWFGFVYGLSVMNNVVSVYDHHGKDYSNFTDGVNYFLITPTYVPYDSTGPVGYTFTTMLIAAGQSSFACTVVTADILFTTVSVHLCFQLYSLRCSIQNLESRAQDSIKLSKRSEAPDDMFLVMYEKCLIENVKHHVQIIRCFNKLQEWFSPLLFVVYYSSAVMICLTGIILLAPGPLTQGIKMPSILIMLAELGHVFLYCYFAEQIITLTEEVRQALYFSNWYNIQSKSVNRILHIMKERIKVPMALSSAKIVYANLHSFLQVLSSAYSYFNLLRATQKKFRVSTS